MKEGKPGAMSTSTSTMAPSSPTTAQVITLASMLYLLYHKPCLCGMRLEQRDDKKARHNADEDYLYQGADDVADKGAECRLQSALRLPLG